MIKTNEDYFAPCNEAYFEAQRARVKKLFSAKHKEFGSGSEFAEWYVAQLKQYSCKCFYCETSIHDINKLIAAGSLKTRSVRGDGNRGPVLEVDKQENGYCFNDCVLACYYCNNDKSYTCTKSDYKKYFGPARKSYFDILLDKLKQ